MNSLTRQKVADAVAIALDSEKLLIKEIAYTFGFHPNYLGTLRRNPDEVPESTMKALQTWMYSGKPLKGYKVVVEETPEMSDTAYADKEALKIAKKEAKERLEKLIAEQAAIENAEKVNPSGTDPFESLVKLKPGALERRQKELEEREQKTEQPEPVKKQKHGFTKGVKQWITNDIDRQILVSSYAVIPEGWRRGKMKKFDRIISKLDVPSELNPVFIKVDDPAYMENIAKAVDEMPVDETGKPNPDGYFEAKEGIVESEGNPIESDIIKYLEDIDIFKERSILSLTKQVALKFDITFQDVMLIAAKYDYSYIADSDTALVNTPDTPHEAVDEEVFSEHKKQDLPSDEVDGVRKMTKQQLETYLNSQPMVMCPKHREDIHQKIILDIEIRVTVKQ
jgi:hypothetical protein